MVSCQAIDTARNVGLPVGCFVSCFVFCHKQMIPMLHPEAVCLRGFWNTETEGDAGRMNYERNEKV